MVHSQIGTEISFPRNGKRCKRELVGYIEINCDYWHGDLGWDGDTFFMVYGHTSNGVPVLHNLEIVVEESTAPTEIINQGITFKLPRR